jgi:hypothetical protein
LANLTLTIDEEVLKKARIRALEEGTSVNALVREYLESYTGTQPVAGIIEDIVSLSRKARSRRGAARWKRDDLHDRSL